MYSASAVYRELCLSCVCICMNPFFVLCLRFPKQIGPNTKQSGRICVFLCFEAYMYFASVVYRELCLSCVCICMYTFFVLCFKCPNKLVQIHDGVLVVLFFVLKALPQLCAYLHVPIFTLCLRFPKQVGPNTWRSARISFCVLKAYMYSASVVYRELCLSWVCICMYHLFVLCFRFPKQVGPNTRRSACVFFLCFEGLHVLCLTCAAACAQFLCSTSVFQIKSVQIQLTRTVPQLHICMCV